MAQRLARIPIITEPIDDLNMAIESINFRIDEINRIFQEVELEQAKTSGNDSNIPKFNNNLNLQNNKITNVGRSSDPQDVVTRKELEEIGILGSRTGQIQISGDLAVDGTVTVLGGGTGSAEVTTNYGVESFISTALDENVATSKSGDIIVEEDAAGINGSTSGTLAMGREGNKKAEFLQLRNGELIIQDPAVRALLEILIEEIRGLKNGF